MSFLLLVLFFSIAYVIVYILRWLVLHDDDEA